MSLSGCFSKVLRNGFCLKSNFGYCGALVAKYSKIWEPDYLILAETKTPEYDLINIQIKGYDFVILEKYQKLIRSLAKKMKINVQKSWPAPEENIIVHYYKPNSTDIEHKYDLNIYERNVQVADVKSHIMPLFIEFVVTTCPPGVKLSFHEHTDEIEQSVYLPNIEILELQKELENVGKVNRKKGKSKK